MSEISHFQPSEWDEVGKIFVSPRNFSDFGDEYLFSIYEEMLTVRNVERFREIVSQLVFHARHLTTAQHAILAARLSMKFSKAIPESRDPEFDAEVLEAIQPPRSRPFFSHPWQGISRENLRKKISEKYGKTDQGAEKSIQKAKKTLRGMGYFVSKS